MSIQEFEEYFKSVSLPERIELHKSIVIVDVPLFIEGHLAVIKSYGIDNKSSKPFVDRLIRVKGILSGQPE
jgi:hypothetical protein